MNTKKVARKRKLVERLEWELTQIRSDKRKTTYQKTLLQNGKTPEEAKKLATDRHMVRLTEAKEGL